MLNNIADPSQMVSLEMAESKWNRNWFEYLTRKKIPFMGGVLDDLFCFLYRVNYDMLSENWNKRECVKRGDEKKTIGRR